MIGTGNLAFHLSAALRKAKCKLVQVVGTNKSKTEQFAKQNGFSSFTHSLTEIDSSADVCFICVNDDKIEEISRKIKLPGKLVLHCSGTIPLKTLYPISENCAVLYPLYTFSTSDKTVDFKKVPLFVETANQKSKLRLMNIAKKLSSSITQLDSVQREKLHLAAVISANFSNYLFQLAWDYLQKERVPHVKRLIPLLEKTIEKLNHNQPAISQTGPARRGDVKTIRKHISLLKNHSEQQVVYRLFSKLIQQHFQPKRI